MLVVMMLCTVAVLGAAVWIDPYSADGRPRASGTHQQLGLPPCTYLLRTGDPCPSCGLTTSFSLAMHGDLYGSVRANWVGTLMVGFLLACVPWAAWCAWRGHLVGVRSLEFAALGAMGVFAVLLLARWGVVLWVARTG